MMKLKLILGLLLFGIAVILITQNVNTVPLYLLFWTAYLPLSVFAFILFAIGIVAGWLLHAYSAHRARFRNRP